MNDIESTSDESNGEYSVDDDDQLQPGDTLDDRGVEDVLDEGFSPPDYPPKGAIRGLTAQEQADGETLDERLSEEEPEVGATDPIDDIEADEHPASDWRSHDSDQSPEFTEDDEVGADRAGRLIAPDEGTGPDIDSEAIADDAGIDGAGASAEEAAVHYINPPD